MGAPGTIAARAHGRPMRWFLSLPRGPQEPQPDVTATKRLLWDASPGSWLPLACVQMRCFPAESPPRIHGAPAVHRLSISRCRTDAQAGWAPVPGNAGLSGAEQLWPPPLHPVSLPALIPSALSGLRGGGHHVCLQIAISPLPEGLQTLRLGTPPNPG